MYSFHQIYNWEKYTVLIVEDDYFSVFYLKEILKDTGIQMEIVNDGRPAIEMCKNNPGINIILMDIKLPTMNGLDATLEIKKLMPDVPIIAQTACALPNDIENCIKSGCIDYVAKPFDPVELLEKMGKALKSMC